MSDSHIKHFIVENFKKFNSLEVKDIGQFNLIVGDNNVGKTSFLEALILNGRIKENLGVLSTLMRYNNPMFEPAKMKKSDPSYNFKENIFAQNLHSLDRRFHLFLIKHNPKENLSYTVEHRNDKLSHHNNGQLKDFARDVISEYPEINLLSENWLFAYVDKEPVYIIDITSKFYEDFVNTPWSLPMIQMKDVYDTDTFLKYSQLTGREEDKVVDLLNLVFQDLNIVKIRTNPTDIQILTSNRAEYHSITQYGGGVLRILRFVIEILKCEDNRLMIDEVEIGIHHSKLESFWRIIFQLGIETGVQLFMTTHSKECIDAFVKASSDETIHELIRLIELEEGIVESKVYASTYTFEQIKTGINSNINLRG